MADDEMQEGAEEGEQQQADPELEYLQQLVRVRRSSLQYLPDTFPQIKDNEFLQRENLLLEAYLAKIDFSKIGFDFDEDAGVKVRCM